MDDENIKIGQVWRLKVDAFCQYSNKQLKDRPTFNSWWPPEKLVIEHIWRPTNGAISTIIIRRVNGAEESMWYDTLISNYELIEE